MSLQVPMQMTLANNEDRGVTTDYLPSGMACLIGIARSQSVWVVATELLWGYGMVMVQVEQVACLQINEVIYMSTIDSCLLCQLMVGVCIKPSLTSVECM